MLHWIISEFIIIIIIPIENYSWLKRLKEKLSVTLNNIGNYPKGYLYKDKSKVFMDQLNSKFALELIIDSDQTLRN